MKIYPSMKALLSAVVAGEIPIDCGTPSWAAEIMGITPSAVTHRIHQSGSLEAWGTKGGYVLVSHRSIKKAMEKKTHIEGQGEFHEFAS